MDELVAILHTCMVRTDCLHHTGLCGVSATKNEYKYKAAIPIKMTGEINDDAQKKLYTLYKAATNHRIRIIICSCQNIGGYTKTAEFTSSPLSPITGKRYFHPGRQGVCWLHLLKKYNNIILSRILHTASFLTICTSFGRCPSMILAFQCELD